MNTLANTIGMTVSKQDDMVRMDDSRDRNTNYPLAPIDLDKQENPYDIIFLVAESMRAQDLFNETVMLDSLDFADKYGNRFNGHCDCNRQFQKIFL